MLEEIADRQVFAMAVDVVGAVGACALVVEEAEDEVVGGLFGAGVRVGHLPVVPAVADVGVGFEDVGAGAGYAFEAHGVGGGGGDVPGDGPAV